MRQKQAILISLTLLICSLSFKDGFGQVSNPESIQLIEKDNEWFIQHRISKGETFYSLSRTYSVSVDDITLSNPGSSSSVGIDEVILIPISDKYSYIHQVQAGETIYSISSKNSVRAEDLRKWNGIEDNDISVGQQLKIFSFKQEMQGAEKTAFNIIP